LSGPAFYESILNSTAQPVWVVDDAGIVQFANPAALAALGYDDRSEIEGRPVAMKEDGLVRRDGSTLQVGYSATPIELADGQGTVYAVSGFGAEALAARRILETGDLARRRLARDLHDGAQQQLIAAVTNLQLAQQKWDSDPARSRAHLDAGVEQVELGRTTLRELVAGIHPPILTHLGLVAAVEALIASLPVPVSLDLTDQRFARSLEASVYFFVSEALTNMVKHARATRASVRVAVADGGLIVEVIDDGVGGANVIDGGTGLMGLVDRIAALDGELTVTSPAHVGTTLLAEIPLPEKLI
jgi:signal transduction histidine kinase